MNFAIGLLVAGIDWRAHLGGALTGAAMAGIMIYAPRQSRVLWQTLGTLAVLMILILLVISRTAQLQALLLR